MSVDAMNMLVILIGAVLWLFEILRLAGGKRVLKESVWIKGAANFAILGVGLSTVLDGAVEAYYLVPAFSILIIFFIIISYYNGIHYNIHTQDGELVMKVLPSLIAECINVKVEQIKEDKIIRYILSDTSKSVELKESESMFSSKKSYRLTFKKWFENGTRQEIIYSLEEYLQDHEEYQRSRISMGMQLIGAVVLIIAGALATSYMVMEPREIRGFIQDPPPMELYGANGNKIITDPEIIRSLHEELKKSIGFKEKDMNYEKLKNITKITFDYGYKGKTIHGNKYVAYIFMSDAEIRNKSSFHWVCWKIHSLYDRRSGTYYRFYVAVDLEELLADLYEGS